MGRATENGYIVMTELLSTVQDLYGKLSSPRVGAEWQGALGTVHTCRVVCGHQGWKGLTASMNRAESLLGLDFNAQHQDDVLRLLDEVIGELRPRVHGAPTIPSGPPKRSPLA
jgi:hypothetical protein